MIAARHRSGGWIRACEHVPLSGDICPPLLSRRVGQWATPKRGTTAVIGAGTGRRRSPPIGRQTQGASHGGHTESGIHGWGRRGDAHRQPLHRHRQRALRHPPGCEFHGAQRLHHRHRHPLRPRRPSGLGHHPRRNRGRRQFLLPATTLLPPRSASRQPLGRRQHGDPSPASASTPRTRSSSVHRPPPSPSTPTVNSPSPSRRLPPQVR